MKRKVFAFFLCACLLTSLVLSASASTELPMVIDDAGLLTDIERNELEEKAKSLRSTYEMDVVILTVDTLNGKSAQNYADDYYDENGYGYGNDYSGILFLLAMEEREWYISTCGDAIYAFPDYGLDRLGELVVPDLSGGDYYNAFVRYLDALPSYFEEYGEGQPMDGHGEPNYNPDPYSPNRREEIVYYQPKHQVNIAVSLLLGVVAAVIVILVMCSTMNTRRRQSGAANYLKPGSYHLYNHQDLFLYSRVSKVRRQENNGGHGGGRSGGSHVHRSSGGRSHGGRGGRF